MIGVVVVGHGQLGEAMVAALESVVGRQPQFVAVATRSTEPPEQMRARIAACVHDVDDGSGVIICTDMLGDTETNQSLIVARETGAEVVAGVNMPMLLKLCTDRRRADAPRLAELLLGYGREHIRCPTAKPSPLRLAR